jgi:hypothetical protein
MNKFQEWFGDHGWPIVCYLIAAVQVALIVLKLLGVIHAPWSVVFLPIAIPVVLVVILCVMIGTSSGNPFQ